MERRDRIITRIWAAALASCIVALPAHRAAASGGFVVDDADIDQPGQCKVESWHSAADNREQTLSVSPACTFNLGGPIEINPQFTAVRSAGEWTPFGALLFKTAILPRAAFPVLRSRVGRRST